MDRLLLSIFLLLSAEVYGKEIEFECSQNNKEASIPVSIDLERGLVSYGGSISDGGLIEVSYSDDNVILASGLVSKDLGKVAFKQQVTFFISRKDGKYVSSITMVTFDYEKNTSHIVPAQSYSGNCYRYGF
jgi:hypothetical protein